MEKLIRDGQVAIIYSPDFGAGWSSWNPEYPQILFDPVLVHHILDENSKAIAAHIAEHYPNIFAAGRHQLMIKWIPQGTAFRIHEYDGSESVEIREDMKWIVA